MDKNKMIELVKNAPEGATHWQGGYLIVDSSGRVTHHLIGGIWHANIVNCSVDDIADLITELDYSVLDEKPVYWGGKLKMEQGDIYLDDDSQSCKFISRYKFPMGDDYTIVGHMFEHPDCNGLPCINLSTLSNCMPVDTRTDQEKLIDEVAEIIKGSGALASETARKLTDMFNITKKA